MLSDVFDHRWEFVEGLEKSLSKISTIRIKVRRQSCNGRCIKARKCFCEEKTCRGEYISTGAFDKTSKVMSHMNSTPKDSKCPRGVREGHLQRSWTYKVSQGVSTNSSFNAQHVLCSLIDTDCEAKKSQRHN